MLQNQLTSYFICLFILLTIKSYTNYKSTKLIQINVTEVNNIIILRDSCDAITLQIVNNGTGVTDSKTVHHVSP